MKYPKWISEQPVYIWLFAAYPILYLYANNMVFLDGREVLRVLAITLVIVTALFAGLWAVFRHKMKSSIVTALMVILFFSYGHIFYLILYTLQKYYKAIGLLHYILYPVIIDLFVGFVLVALKHHERIRRATGPINASALLLMSFVIIQIVSGLRVQASLESEIAIETNPDWVAPEVLPDIYYIVVDAYARQDQLAEQFGFDNTAFIDALTARGFYVAPESCSNYSVTSLSIPSTLNMRYFERSELADKQWRLALSYLALYAQKNSRVGQALHDRGYTYIHFGTAYPATARSEVADLNLDFGPDGTFETDNAAKDYFSNLLLPTTLYNPFYKYQATTVDGAYDRFSADRIILELAELERIPQRPEPTFTVAHILKPHYPYVFDREGNRITKPAGWEPNDDLYVENADAMYVDQLVYTNQRILDVLDTLLANSDTPPIIILQGDHGWRQHDVRYLPDRLLILNAYYVPEPMRSRLYANISPVNTFRLMLDSLFGTDLGLLPDKSYPSYDENRLFELKPISDDFEWRCDGLPNPD